jgi:carboxylesterase type B
VVSRLEGSIHAGIAEEVQPTPPPPSRNLIVEQSSCRMGVSQSKASEHILHTPKGSLKGIQLTSKDGKPIYQRYTKLPYAQPPVGPLRWRRPQPLPPDWSFNSAPDTPGDHTKFGPVCPQPVYDHKKATLDNPDAAPLPPHIHDEECLFVNVFVPPGPPPPTGWPVVFFIHGGWLQVGDAMQDHVYDPEDLFTSTDHPRIIISPTYRLNLLGFLAGQPLADAHEDEAPGNYGFWDQRMALEWTAENVKHFGGNANNVTVGGLSAGANSTFFQLYYDTYQPPEKRLIKRVFLWSNAVGIQPDSATSHKATSQFTELCTAVGVDTSLSSPAQLAALRKIPSTTLIASIARLKLHTFRGTTDNSFIPPSFLQTLHSGSFTTLLADHGISVLVGEVANEWNLYKLVNPPTSLAGLRLQLRNYYPDAVVEALLEHYTHPAADGGSDTEQDAWRSTYARIVADCQVHAVIRGLTSILLSPPDSSGVRALPESAVHRYRICWRAASMDGWIDPNVGVCHGADAPVWWCSGFRAGYTEDDRKKVKEFLGPFGRFIAGEETEWGAEGLRGLREMGRDGVTRTVVDEEWEGGMGVWECMKRAQGM